MNVLVGPPFQLGEGPDLVGGRGLLRDCENLAEGSLQSLARIAGAVLVMVSRV